MIKKLSKLNTCSTFNYICNIFKDKLPLFILMKKVISYIFLLGLVVKPIANISMVSYYQFNISEIIDKYCINKDKPALNCNGKCYLSKQLSAVDNSSQEDNKINITESFVLLFLNQTIDYNLDYIKSKIKKNLISHYTKNYKAVTADVTTPPPKYL